MKPHIKLTIGTNGSVVTDMTGFENCSARTNQVLSTLNLATSNIDMKDEEVRTVSQGTVNVNSH